MTLTRRLAIAALLLPAALCGLSPAQAHQIRFKSLVIHHPWARQSPMAATVAAGYMRITNTGAEEDRLIAVSSAISQGAEIHDMTMQGDVMKMSALPGGVPIPPGATVTLKPGSLHVMFTGLTSRPVEGVSFTGTLTFAKAGRVDVEFEVMAPGATPHEMMEDMQ